MPRGASAPTISVDVDVDVDVIGPLIVAALVSGNDTVGVIDAVD